jgi:hypothetical protein
LKQVSNDIMIKLCQQQQGGGSGAAPGGFLGRLPGDSITDEAGGPSIEQVD